MKRPPRILSVVLPLFLGILICQEAGAEEARLWTSAKSNKSISGKLLRKDAKQGSIVVLKDDGKEVTIKTAELIQKDQDYVAKWEAPAEAPKGIVRGKATGLTQAEGGKSRVMEDLKSVLSDYGAAREDTDPHPEAFVYKGPALHDGGGQISIPYLMPLNEALGLLVKRPGPASRRPAVAPGFPPGMMAHEYDIRFGVYNRMFIITDAASQVVALQVKAETKNDPTIPAEPDWKAAQMPNGSTSDFIEPKTGGASAHVLDLRKPQKRIVIDLEAKGETVLHLPEPMIRLCLFHIEQDLRKR